MMREECINWLKSLKTEIGKSEHGTLWHYAEAINMAIEALTEPKTIIGIDIPYGSDKGIATLFKGKDDKLILEEVKEIMSLVRCKDCRYYECAGLPCPLDVCESLGDDGFCSCGERKGGGDE